MTDELSVEFMHDADIPQRVLHRAPFASVAESRDKLDNAIADQRSLRRNDGSKPTCTQWLFAASSASALLARAQTGESPDLCHREAC